MVALFFAFLTYGSLKRWRWVFWAYVLLLGGFVISALQFPSQSTLALLVDVISGVVGAVLFVVSYRPDPLRTLGDEKGRRASGQPDELVAPVRTYRPSAKAMLGVLALGPVALIFTGVQLHLAGLRAGTATAFAVVNLLAVLALGLGWLAFLRNARVSVNSDDVIVHDWLGRVVLQAPRTQVRLELVSVQWWGRYHDGAILAIVDGSDAVAVWRETWGPKAIRNLASQLRDVAGQSKHRTLTADALRKQYPQVRLANLPAIAVVVVLVVSIAVVLTRQ
jgi:hypothetical protein